MTRVQAVAACYGLLEADVAHWPSGIIDVFYRRAQRKGWLQAQASAA